jgi:hypothetical protein
VTSRERAEALLHKLEMSNAPYAQRLDAVERAIEAAVAEEREACAKVAEHGASMYRHHGDEEMARHFVLLADNIRAQGAL